MPRRSSGWAKPCFQSHWLGLCMWPLPTCKRSWEMQYLAGHLVIFLYNQDLISKEKWSKYIVEGYWFTLLSEASLRMLLMFMSWIHLVFFVGRMRKVRNAVVTILEIKTDHNKHQRSVHDIVFKLALNWEIFVVMLSYHIFSNEEMFAVTMSWKYDLLQFQNITEIPMKLYWFLWNNKIYLGENIFWNLFERPM